MASYRLDDTVPVTALAPFTRGVVRAAREHGAAAVAVLPDGEADLALLEALSDATEDADAALRAAEGSYLGAAAIRDDALALARKSHSDLLARVRAVVQTVPGGGVLAVAHRRCSAPSRLGVAPLAAEMEQLCLAALDHARLLARVNADLPLIEEPRRRREALLAADEARESALRRRIESCAHRDQARTALVVQLRRVLTCLDLVPDSGLRTRLRSYRMDHLPRYNRKPRRAAEAGSSEG